MQRPTSRGPLWRLNHFFVITLVFADPLSFPWSWIQFNFLAFLHHRWSSPWRTTVQLWSQRRKSTSKPLLLLFHWLVNGTPEPPHHRELTRYMQKPVCQKLSPLSWCEHSDTRSVSAKFYQHPMWIEKVEGTKIVNYTSSYTYSKRNVTCNARTCRQAHLWLGDGPLL